MTRQRFTLPAVAVCFLAGLMMLACAAGNPLSNKTLWNLYKETEEKLRAFHDRWVIVSTENLIYNENQVT